MTAVKYFTNNMTGAPVMEGPAGAMIAVLDACLVNGFGLGTLDSLTVSGGIATATRAAGHPFQVGTVALIDGATPAGLNGQKRVLSVTTTTYTFDATGISNQTATGTITHRVAPCGFEKVFTGTNLAVYRSPNVAGTRMYLRIDDTATRIARASGYETMSDVNTGTGQFPTGLGAGFVWGKSNNAASSGRSWILIGDDRGFVLSVAFNGTFFSTVHFGDFASRKSPDAYACVINGSVNTSTVDSTSGTDAGDLGFFHPNNDMQLRFARGSSGLNASAIGRRTCAVPGGSMSGSWSGQSGNGYPAYPNPADNGLLLSPVMLTDTAGAVSYRGILPGVYYAPQNIGNTTFASGEIVTGVQGLTGRILRAINHGTNGVLFVDSTGPWR